MLAKKPDIILLALARWDGPYSSTAFSLAKELSRECRVFYVDNPFTLKRALRRFRGKQVQSRLQPLFLGRSVDKPIDSQNKNLINVRPSIVIPINFLKRGTLYTFLSKVNDFILNHAIESVVRKHNLSDYIVINSFNPFYLREFRKLKPALSIYHCVDNMGESKYIRKHGKYLEESVMQNYDITITTSKKLFEKASAFSKQVFYLPNAADFNHFHTATNQSFDPPKELVGLKKKKIIGYIGNICLRINYQLIKQISASHPDKIILMVGPVTDQDLYRYELDKQPNIVITGQKPYQDLPRYLHFMDCAIIPFKCNELTSNIYPLKLNEYLAAGKPVVTTNFSPDLEDFCSIIKIEDSIESFVAAIAEEIETDNENKQQRRMTVAKKNTWSSRVEEFWLKVEPFIHKEKKGQYVSQEG